MFTTSINSTYHSQWDEENPNFQHHYLANLMRTAYQEYNFIEAMDKTFRELMPDLHYEYWACGNILTYESLSYDELDDLIEKLQNKIQDNGLPIINVKTKTDCTVDYGLDWRFFSKFYPTPIYTYPQINNQSGKEFEVKLYDIDTLGIILRSPEYLRWKEHINIQPYKNIFDKPNK
jgi:hypothetical protein